MKAVRTNTYWMSLPVFKDDEHNEFIRIGRYTVDVTHNGKRRSDEDIKKDAAACKAALMKYY